MSGNFNGQYPHDNAYSGAGKTFPPPYNPHQTGSYYTPNQYPTPGGYYSGQPMYPGQYVQPGGEYKHSGCGIASLLIAIVSDVILFFLLCVSAHLVEEGYGESDEVIIVGLGFLSFMSLLVVSTILAIIGLCQARRKMVFPILGLFFSVVPLVILMFLMFLGVAIE
ncbi:MAG: hypothetical protein Q4D38_04255 [Planctomycetia bacterium]|nr:hypothetical protein [Planctomycetia bacterium]